MKTMSHQKARHGGAVLASSLICALCLTALLGVASARGLRELRGTSSASDRRVLISEEFSTYEDTACDDDNLEKGRRLDTWQLCQKWCQESAGCHAFDYNENNNRCYLKASCNSMKSEQNHRAGVVAGQASDVSSFTVEVDPPLVAFEQMDGVECGGDEIPGGALMNIRSRRQCEEECESRIGQGCQAYTWNESNKRCYLKKDPCIGEKAEGRRFSGKVAGESSVQVFGDSVPEVDFKRMDAMECGGVEIADGSLKGIPSRESCELACASRANQGCKAYTWNESNQRCYLKEGQCIGEKAERGRYSGVVVESAEAQALEVVEDEVFDDADDGSDFDDGGDDDDDGSADYDSGSDYDYDDQGSE